jgi:transposase
VNRPGFCST